MKNRKHAGPVNSIKEINVDLLLDEMRRRDSDESIPSGQNKLKNATLKAMLPPIHPKQVNPEESRRVHGVAIASRTISELGNSTLKFQSSENQGTQVSGSMSKAKKKRLRQKRKLEGSLQGLQIASDADSVSQDSVIAESPTRHSHKQFNRTRRNYVERTSMSTANIQSQGKCGWRDVICVLFVIISIIGAGILRFQEEVFGTVDHIRLESDLDADFYEILGIPHSATPKDIKRAYRNKVLEVHPDHNPNCSDCQQTFVATSRAYETLFDPDKRKVYDQTRGSYEPITSDYSVSLTAFNYDRVVSQSSSVWIIQVYDDLDSHSKHFAQHWDAVAGSDLGDTVGIKFGRVNARRDRAVLSLLPMRARTFPSVMMFSRDTMPSILSLADTSSRALRRWVIQEVPSHVGESSSSNAYRVVVKGGKSGEPGVAVKVASVNYARIFDFDFEPAKEAPITVSVIKKGSGRTLATLPATVNLLKVVEGLKERLAIPLTRSNLFDVCTNQEAVDVSTVYCVSVLGTDPVLIPAPLVQNEILLQRVSLPGDVKNVVLDLQGSASAPFWTAVSDLVIEDLRFTALSLADFIDATFPRGILGRIQDNLASIAVLSFIIGSLFAATKVTPVKITVAIAVMSIVIGIFNAVPFTALLETIKALIGSP